MSGLSMIAEGYLNSIILFVLVSTGRTLHLNYGQMRDAAGKVR